MPSSQRGSLLCPFPVLFYWALWKTDGSCIVSKCPSLGNLLGCSSRTFCLCHLLSKDNTSSVLSSVAFSRGSPALSQPGKQERPCLAPHC